MSSVQTTDVLREWRESAAYWQDHSATIRSMFSPVTQALIEDAHIKAGDAVLDVAAGPGEPSLTIAELVGHTGAVTCTDAVAEMVMAAQGEADKRGIKNVFFQQCMADDLPFESDSFDAAVSRLGVMFFPDPVAGVSEMLRVIKPGAAVSFAVWSESRLNPFAYIVTDVLARHIKMPPADPEALGAFRFAEPGKLAHVLETSGTLCVRERQLEFHIQAPISRDEFWEMRSGTSGTLREKLAAMPPEQQSQLALDVREALTEFFPDEQMSFPARMLIVTGYKA